MFIPGNGGGLGAPGQRQSSVENFESRVKIPAAQFALIIITYTILGLYDALFLFLLVFWLGARGTWLACGVVAVPLVFVAVRRFAALRRYQYPIAVAVIAAAAWWFVYGYDAVFEYNWPAMFDVPTILMVILAMPIAPSHYFVRYFVWAMRTDMTDPNFTPTRRPIPGETEPLGPDTKYKQLMPEPPAPNTTTLVNKYSIPEQSIKLSDGRAVTLYDTMRFLEMSTTKDDKGDERGLTEDVARACGKRRGWQKAVVHHLQGAGLATQNGQGKASRLVKSPRETLVALGFNLGDNTDDEPDDDEPPDDSGGDMT